MPEPNHPPNTTRLLGTLLLAACAAAPVTAAEREPRLVDESIIEHTANLSTLRVHDGGIDAVLENRSTRVLDDIVVIVRYDWLWKDELNPGEHNPGWVEYVTVDERLLPGERIPFVYTPRKPLPQRNDGWFAPSAEVVGATVYAERE